MNNAWLIHDSVLSLDTYTVSRETLEEQEGEILRVLEAVKGLKKSNEWRTLKELVFDGLTERLTKDLNREARRDTPEVTKLAHLSGQLRWAERYSDLSTLEKEYKARLSSIRQTYGTTQENPGDYGTDR